MTEARLPDPEPGWFYEDEDGTLWRWADYSALRPGAPRRFQWYPVGYIGGLGVVPSPVGELRAVYRETGQTVSECPRHCSEGHIYRNGCALR